MPFSKIKVGTAKEAKHPDSIRAGFAEFFSMIIFVFAGEGSAMAFSMIIFFIKLPIFVLAIEIYPILQIEQKKKKKNSCGQCGV